YVSLPLDVPYMTELVDDSNFSEIFNLLTSYLAKVANNPLLSSLSPDIPCATKLVVDVWLFQKKEITNIVFEYIWVPPRENP
ncbi:8603_t:CDS:2, partial [Gigaspora rosea]